MGTSSQDSSRALAAVRALVSDLRLEGAIYSVEPASGGTFAVSIRYRAPNGWKDALVRVTKARLFASTYVREVRSGLAASIATELLDALKGAATPVGPVAPVGVARVSRRGTLVRPERRARDQPSRAAGAGACSRAGA